ncbi:hypothetical protein [Streptomyces sp. N35]|uniref:hypothetical protein n=1 Tax=Streptomyces sp. N35 TaxID=2795730 RepID=UPI0018F71E26|nr:hypothetical protein [Streptomyces sp. N35]
MAVVPLQLVWSDRRIRWIHTNDGLVPKLSLIDVGLLAGGLVRVSLTEMKLQHQQRPAGNSRGVHSAGRKAEPVHLREELVELLGYAEVGSGITLSALIGEFAGPYSVREVRGVLDEIGARSVIIRQAGAQARSPIAYRLPDQQYRHVALSRPEGGCA